MSLTKNDVVIWGGEGQAVIANCPIPHLVRGTVTGEMVMFGEIPLYRVPGVLDFGRYTKKELELEFFGVSVGLRAELENADVDVGGYKPHHETLTIATNASALTNAAIEGTLLIYEFNGDTPTRFLEYTSGTPASGQYTIDWEESGGAKAITYFTGEYDDTDTLKCDYFYDQESDGFTITSGFDVPSTSLICAIRTGVVHPMTQEYDADGGSVYFPKLALASPVPDNFGTGEATADTLTFKINEKPLIYYPPVTA